MWQMSSVFSHESAQRNDAGHIICENVSKTKRPYCYQWFRVSTRQAMLQNTCFVALPDEWKHENIGSSMAVLF